MSRQKRMKQERTSPFFKVKRRRAVLPVFMVALMLISGCGQTAAPSPTDTSTPSSAGPAVPSGNTPALMGTEASPEAPSPSGEPAPAPDPEDMQSPSASGEPSGTDTPSLPPPVERTDYAAYGANELGRVPIVMFHRFVEEIESVTDKYYTCTFAQLETLLQTLHDRNFRLISMTDFLAGRVAVPAGFKPVVFTFDDGTPSQFSLVEQDGRLVVNPRSAVGVMLAFAEKHPDFGIGGTFYLNMDVNFFSGDGTKEERLRHLLSLGYEIGTHTWGHVDFTAKGTPADVQAALGRNQKALDEILPGHAFQTLALPYGSRPKDKANRVFLGQGEWEGIPYQLDGALAVGAGPTVPPHHARFDPLYVARVRATGKVAEEADLDWWLENAPEKSWYVSDGNPDTLVFPREQEGFLVPEKADSFRPVAYEP